MLPISFLCICNSLKTRYTHPVSLRPPYDTEPASAGGFSMLNGAHRARAGYTLDRSPRPTQRQTNSDSHSTPVGSLKSSFDLMSMSLPENLEQAPNEQRPGTELRTVSLSPDCAPWPLPPPPPPPIKHRQPQSYIDSLDNSITIK